MTVLHHHRRVLVLWTLCICLLCAGTARASDDAHRFLSGLQAYKNGDYTTAIDDFTALTRSGVTSGPLYYNLGNACLKSGELGRAILWYERARQRMPNDPDLAFNLDYARSLTKDAPEESTSPLVRIFFFWNYHFSRSAIKVAAITGNLLFWLFFAIWRLTRRRGLFRAAVVTAVPAAILLLTAAFNYYADGHRQEAIVLPAETAVRSGLETTSTELFVLHAGAKVAVIKQRKEYYQIRFSADKIGWVEKTAVGLI